MIGRLAPEGTQRDAVHFAVIPMIAQERLLPGARISAEGKETVTAAAIGIVDPFLPPYYRVEEGQRFWCFLNPGSITGLRHVWSHPSFVQEQAAAATSAEVAAAEKWLTDKIRAMNGQGLPNLLEAVDYAITKQPDGYGGDGIICFGTDFQDYSHEANAEFWRYWSTYTGRPIPTVAPNAYFRCAC